MPSRFPLSRRALLRAGASATLATTLGTTILPPAAQAVDWATLFSKRMPDMGGTVKELIGEATADERPVRVGDEIPSGARVHVSEGGRAAIELEDGSIFTLSGGTTLELILSRMSEGILNLIAGTLLLVVNSGGRYLVAGSTTSFGIKGTVVYRQIFTPEERTGNTMEGPVKIPRSFGEYFCTCNGDVDWLLSGRNTPYAHTLAQYHDAYYFNPADPTRRIKAPMMNHQDEDIRHLVQMQDKHPHDISWLKH